MLTILEDIKAIYKGDPAMRSRKSAIFEFILYQGFHAIILHRLSHFLWRIHLPFIPRLISQIARIITGGIEIHPGAKIGKGFFIDHGAGVVIGETAEIGNNVLMYHQVTLGTQGGMVDAKERRHPKIGHNVMIGAGAKLFGPIEIGDNSQIGGASVVTKNVPPNSIVVGNPGRIIKQAGKKIIDPSGIMHLPDPVKNEINSIKERIEKLESSS